MAIRVSLNKKSMNHGKRGAVSGDSVDSELSLNLFILSDGVSNSRSAPESSKLACQYFKEELLKTKPDLATLVVSDAKKRVIDAMASASRRLAQNRPASASSESTQVLSPMDSLMATLCVVWFVGDQVISANIGDSRVYLYRDKQILRLSRDYSMAYTRMVDMKHLSEEEFYLLPKGDPRLEGSNLLSCYMGQPEGEEFICSVRTTSVRKGDRIAMFSDGLIRRYGNPGIDPLFVRTPFENLWTKLNQECAGFDGDDVSAWVLDINDIGYKMETTRGIEVKVPTAEEREQAVKQVTFFEGITSQELDVITAHCELKLFSDGAQIIKKGEHADSLYILISGTVEVWNLAKKIKRDTMVAPRCFGENAVFKRKRVRNADVVAKGDVITMKMSEESIRFLKARHKNLYMELMERVAADEHDKMEVAAGQADQLKLEVEKLKSELARRA